MASKYDDARIAIDLREKLFHFHAVSYQQFESAVNDPRKLQIIANAMTGLDSRANDEDTSIDNLFATNCRLRLALKRYGFTDVRELALLQDDDVETIYGVGKFHTMVIVETLRACGFDLLSENQSRANKALRLYRDEDPPEWIERLGERRLWEDGCYILPAYMS